MTPHPTDPPEQAVHHPRAGDQTVVPVRGRVVVVESMSEFLQTLLVKKAARPLGQGGELVKHGFSNRGIIQPCANGYPETLLSSAHNTVRHVARNRTAHRLLPRPKCHQLVEGVLKSKSHERRVQV